MNWMLAAIVICGASVFTSCSQSDNPFAPDEPDLNVAEKIIGRWIFAEKDGQPVPTNLKNVLNFISPTEAYASASLNIHPEAGDEWYELAETDLVIKGNKITMTNANAENSKVVSEFTITSINDKEFTAIQKLTITVDGEIKDSYIQHVRYEKVENAFSDAILGMWEGHSTGEEGSEFDDGENHRWEYRQDGTFNYFKKEDGHWHISDDAYAEYFVAGNLLCTRWKNAGEGQEEHREWWEIESIKDGVMKWKALRQREDGTTYIATFEMKKVYVPTQAEVEQFILGKWMVSEINGKEAPTNEKIVYEFESLNRAFLSVSLNAKPEVPTVWNAKTEANVFIIDNQIALAAQIDEQNAIFDELIVSYITADVMQCVIIHSDIDGEGNVVTAPAIFYTFKKVADDYSQAVVGIWEGQVTSEQDTFGDGLLHRWEYKADGTYVYYVKDGDNWVPSTNTLNEYFVAGNLLCSRWINGEKEYREWWEIESIKDGVMKWKALRQNADGTTFTSTFEMTKVAE
jgi:hypothetical protein